ncbi:MAG TPA: DMT family transporter [Gemmatimonadales bacterium]|nr:DMT family transporter [Gemmatimonadales bacterium]
MILFLLLALAAGVLLPVQAGLNAQLRVALGSPIAAAFISFLVGTAALGIATLLLRVSFPVGRAWAATHPVQWSGGMIGAVYVLAAVVLAPKLGAGTLVAAVVAGQMVTSLLLDQYGLIGFPIHPLSPLRLLGAVLVIAGVVLIQR